MFPLVTSAKRTGYPLASDFEITKINKSFFITAERGQERSGGFFMDSYFT